VSAAPPTPPADRDVDAAGPVAGTVVGPGDDPDAFEFVAPADGDVRTGEFVTYETTVRGAGRVAVLARVTNATAERGLPGAFGADPDVPPDAVADALGVPTEGIDLDRLTARVVGYFDPALSTFVNPRSLPDPGTSVRTAADAFLEATLPNADWSDGGATAHVGWVLDRPRGAANVHLPIDAVAATHLAVLASTGSGKSYTASVLLEEMLRPEARAAALIFDPHGEYGTLDGMREGDRAAVFRDDDGYVPEVRTLSPDDLSVAIPDLTYGDLLALIDDPSERMKHVLNRAWSDVRGADHITVDDIVTACEAREPDDDAGTAAALEWRLHRTLDRPLFEPASWQDLADLVAPGRATILQLDRLSEEDQQLLAATLLRKLYHARVAAGRDGTDGIDHPVFALMEEGHRFAPDGQARSLGILRTILSEGRKFGFGIGIVSQRPSKLDADVLSQCGTQVIMGITNPADQDAIRQSVESAGEDVIDTLPGLTPGQAVVAGDAMNTPVLIRVRERHTEHDATSADATTDWRQAWDRQSTAPDGVTTAYDDPDVDDAPL
jgi:DNA helicase HerA-like ATPase